VLADADLQALFCAGSVVVILGIIVYVVCESVSARWKTVPRFCPSCQTVAPPTAKYQGSDWVSFLLLLFFFPGCIVYEVWRSSAAKFVCPSCGNAGMIPITAPAAQVRALPSVEPSGPGRFRVSGVDRETRMDCAQYYDAESEQNAKVKAELDGIVVTDVARVA
jgi:hypothetical protein